MLHVNPRAAARWLLLAVLVGLALLTARSPSAMAKGSYQIPTGSVPTVTGTPQGAIATVLDNEQGQAFVRSGPGTVYYDIIGYLVPGQQVPVLGRSPGGEWIQIAYPGAPGGVGWIYTYLVDVKGGQPPIVEPPPTQTPRVTATIDPTLAAQFLVEIPPTRLPTFTPPAPVSVPTFAPDPSLSRSGRVPAGLIIIGMAVVGLFGTLISFLRGR